MEEAERQAVYCAWEDLHWADPSTLELLALYLEQVPTARMLALFTFRPEFPPSWSSRSYLSQLTLGRLGRSRSSDSRKRYRQKNLTRRGGGAGGRENGWGAAVCGRINQNGDRVRPLRGRTVIIS